MSSFMRQISVTYRCAMRYRERELEDTGLTGFQTPYLLALYRRSGLTQEELARELDVNKSTVTRQLVCLEEKGYIYRMSDEEDRRVLRVYPTEKALALQDRLRHVLADWSSFLTEGFSEEERAFLMDKMMQVARRAESYVNGEASVTRSVDRS